MMKQDNDNGTANYVREAGGNRRETAALTVPDQINQHNGLGMFVTFAVGVGVGAVVGLLFAPASGKKTRHYISRTVKDGIDEAASTGKRWSRRAQDTVEDVKANVADVVEAGQKAFRTARDA